MPFLLRFVVLFPVCDFTFHFDLIIIPGMRYVPLLATVFSNLLVLCLCFLFILLILFIVLNVSFVATKSGSINASSKLFGFDDITCGEG